MYISKFGSIAAALGGECKANCRPFADPTGYAPKNSPHALTSPTLWQPLIEDDGLGFFYAQEHVVPHIGFTAKPVILTREEVDARVCPDPEYNLVEETNLIIETVAGLDDFQKTMVEFMDNKINIAG
jgi:hypothetical protein